MAALNDQTPGDDDDDAPKEEGFPIGIPRFHVSQDDLIELERILPELSSRLMMPIAKDRKCRAMFEKLKRIVSDIRWDYGPATQCEEIPAGD